mgnify:FL=1
MNSDFWNSIDGNYTLYKDKRGRKVLKVVTPGGVVGVIGVDMPVTTIQALKERIHCRIIERLQSGESRTVDEPKGE